jgi:Na+-driven multidrug efflux pump
MRIETAYGVLIAVVCFAGAPFIMKLFVTDPEVVDLGVRFLRTISLFYLMPAATNGIQGFFRGIGDLRITLISSILNMAGRVAAASVLVLLWKMEIEALPYSYAFGWVLMLAYELPAMLRYLRKNKM